MANYKIQGMRTLQDEEIACENLTTEIMYKLLGMQNLIDQHDFLIDSKRWGNILFELNILESDIKASLKCPFDDAGNCNE